MCHLSAQGDMHLENMAGEGRTVQALVERNNICTHNEENVAEVSTQAFDGIIKGKDMDALAVSDIAACLDMTEIPELDTDVVAGD
jgi:hypothetical protein